MTIEKNGSKFDQIIIDPIQEHATGAFHKELETSVVPEIVGKKEAVVLPGFPNLIIVDSTATKADKNNGNPAASTDGKDATSTDPYVVLLDAMIADYSDDANHKELFEHQGDSKEQAKEGLAEKESWKQLRDAYVQGDLNAAEIVHQYFGDEVTDKAASPEKPTPTEPLDATGRPEKEGHRARIEQMFKPLSATELATSRSFVERDLSNYKIEDANGKTVSVLDSLNSTIMSKEQRAQVLNAMAEVRERYSSLNSPEQMGSYNHSLGEMGEVIAMTRRQGFTGAQTQQTIMAALFSDSVKAGWSPAMKGNFFSHHLDGAQAAATVMERNGFSKEEVHNVVQAILEHQISPPSFMAAEYTKLIKTSMTSEREKELENFNTKFKTNVTFTEAELQRNNELQKAADRYKEALTEAPRLEALKKSRGHLYDWEAKQFAKHQEILANGKFITSEEAKQIAGIKDALADPLHAEREPGKLGGEIVKFSQSQRDLMAKYCGSGTENWHIPAENSIGQIVVGADGRNNYGPAIDAQGHGTNGTSKIMALRGPLSISTPDATMESAMSAVKASDEGAIKLLPEAQQEHYKQRSAKGAKVYTDAQAATTAWVEEQLRTRPAESLPENLREYRNTPPGTPLANVPYLQAALDLLPPNATAEQRNAWKEKSEVKLAGEIHDHFVNQLRSVNHLDGKHSELSTVRGVPSTELESARERAETSRESNMAKTAPPLSGEQLARQSADQRVVEKMKETLSTQDYRLKTQNGTVDTARVDRVLQLMLSRSEGDQRLEIKDLRDRYLKNNAEAVKIVHSGLGLVETVKPAETAPANKPTDANQRTKLLEAVQKIKTIAADEHHSLDGRSEHERLASVFQRRGVEIGKAKEMAEDLLSKNEHRIGRALESMKTEHSFAKPGALKSVVDELRSSTGALVMLGLIIGGSWAGSGYSNEEPSKPASWK